MEQLQVDTYLYNYNFTCIRQYHIFTLSIILAHRSLNDETFRKNKNIIVIIITITQHNNCILNAFRRMDHHHYLHLSSNSSYRNAILLY